MEAVRKYLFTVDSFLPNSLLVSKFVKRIFYVYRIWWQLKNNQTKTAKRAVLICIINSTVSLKSFSSLGSNHTLELHIRNEGAVDYESSRNTLSDSLAMTGADLKTSTFLEKQVERYNLSKKSVFHHARVDKYGDQILVTWNSWRKLFSEKIAQQLLVNQTREILSSTFPYKYIKDINIPIGG